MCVCVCVRFAARKTGDFCMCGRCQSNVKRENYVVDQLWLNVSVCVGAKCVRLAENVLCVLLQCCKKNLLNLVACKNE